MAKNEEIEKKGFSPDFALENILKTYPKISAKDIALFAPIYYPIADIEIDFEENSFEDFESVQITILKLLALGHTSAEQLAALTGLTSSYIKKIVNLLFNFGHIDTNLKLTPLGAESVKQGKKITAVRGAQRFQLDVLGLNLIRLDKTVNRKIIINKDELSKGVMILDFPDSIEASKIVNDLKNDDFRQIMASKNKLLNVNITTIHGIKCIGIRYVNAFLLKLNGYEPLIFSQREDFSKAGKRKFSWLPFAVSTSAAISLLEIEDLPFYSDEITEKLKKYLITIGNAAKTEKSHESMESAIEAIALKEDYGFQKEDLRCDFAKGEIEILAKSAFTKFNFKTLCLLKTLADNGVLLSTNKNLRGGLIKLYTRDDEILKALDKLNKILEAQGSDDVSTNMKIFIKKVESFTKDTKVNVVDVINNY